MWETQRSLKAEPACEYIQHPVSNLSPFKESRYLANAVLIMLTTMAAKASRGAQQARLCPECLASPPPTMHLSTEINHQFGLTAR